MFKKVLLAALGYVYYYRARLIKALAIPFVVLWILTVFIAAQPGPGVGFLLQILYIFFQMSVVLSTHRIILLGEDSVPTWGEMIWSRDVVRLVRYPVLLALLLIPILFVLGMISALLIPEDVLANGAPAYLGVISLPLLLLFVIVVIRYSLVFPALAAKEEYSLALSWKLTRDYKMLMFNAVILVPFVCGLPFVLLNMIDNALLVTAPLTFVISVVGVAALSVAYSTITGRQLGRVQPLT